MTETNSIVLLTQADRMLAQAKDLPDILNIRDIATAASEYARAAKLGLEAQNKAAEIKLRAERKAGEFLGQLGRSNHAGPGRGNKTISEPVNGFSPYKEAIEEASVTYQDANRYQKVASIPDRVFEQFVNDAVSNGSELTTNKALRLERQLHRQQVYESKIEASQLTGTYNVIYADPPWSYDNSGFNQSAAHQYPTMSLQQICDLSVRDIAGDPCVLYMWATVPLMPEAFEVLYAWGFEYKSHRIWIKNRAPGIGWWVNTKHEILMIAARNGNYHPTERLDSVVYADVSQHSKKPAVFIEDIDRVHPDGFRIELFSRDRREGWDIWGNEHV